ncbi:MAG TPA: helix-turn-helix domain-containing protein [Roseiflexaceae bacterium]|nr:helix-turn-helix domain-containing protein [Roseiflexaceae bacterium]
MDNRSNILHHALALFAARGYEAIGVQEVVDAAGITKPTLYHYFGNKRGLLDMLVRERQAPLLARLEPAARYGGDLTHALRQVAGAYFEFARHEPVFCRMQLAMWFGPPDNDAFQIVAAANARQQQLLEDLFQAAAADHGNMRGRHRLYAAMFLGVINTHIALFLNSHIQLDETALQQAVQHFSYGIYS